MAEELASQMLTRALPGWAARVPPHHRVIGVLEGEGIGPEVIGASLQVLRAVEAASSERFELRYGGSIGTVAERESGCVLSPDVANFCAGIFAVQGALLCGPGGGRFVYTLRTRFDLFCKLVPLQPVIALRHAGVLRNSATSGADILVVRENLGGLYQGDYGFSGDEGARRAYHRFHYDQAQVERILQVGFAAAAQRRRRLCVVHKPGGAPSISQLWQETALQLAPGHAVELRFLEVDNACYQLVADAGAFDVVVAPNMFGDVVADGATLLLGSRGMSYSANFADHGGAVYQTGHGAAYDLAGHDRANPLGQIQSLAMLLHESFGLVHIAAQIREAIETVLAAGWRTADIKEPGCHEVGTAEMGARVAEAVHARLAQPAMADCLP